MKLLSMLVCVFLFGTGTFFIIRLHGFCLVHPIRFLSPLFRSAPPPAGSSSRVRSAVSPVRALCMALAGTLGVGNIVGVASALWLGGPGAVFWMIISALVAMVLKFAEILLAVRHRRIAPDGTPTGGAPYYIRDTMAERRHPKAGKHIANLFALLCIGNALTMGSVLQVNAAAGAMEGAFTIPPILTGCVLAVLTAAVMAGGTKRIAGLTEKLVPFMAVGFLALCITVLILRQNRLPAAIASIFMEAFTLPAGGAGVFGFLTSSAIRSGVMRGLISNEAGCGTAPMAHATAETDSPARQGLLGVCEVFVDTVLLCTVTALTILVSDSGATAYGDDGVRTAQAAFTSVLGTWSGGVFAVAILLFAAATVFCWAHYGMTCVRSLIPMHDKKAEPLGAYLHTNRDKKISGKHFSPPELLFTLLFCASLIFGAVAAPALCWTLADVAIAGMTILNLIFLLLSQKEIVEEGMSLFRH